MPDAQGNLVNTAGYYLMGYPVVNGNVNPVANGFQGLEKVNIAQNDLIADPSRQASFTANLPAGASSLPQLTARRQIPPHRLNIPPRHPSRHSTISATSSSLISTSPRPHDNTWEVAAYNHANASAAGGFPYTPAAPLTTETYTFDAITGKLTSADKSISVPVPNGQRWKSTFLPPNSWRVTTRLSR